MVKPELTGFSSPGKQQQQQLCRVNPEILMFPVDHHAAGLLTVGQVSHVPRVPMGSPGSEYRLFGLQ